MRELALIPTIEEIRAERARRSFNYFLKWSRPTWNWDWPHLVYQQNAIQESVCSTNRSLIIKTPPQHGKTQQNTISLAVWLLLRNPALRVTIASYSQDNANRMSRQAREIAASCDIALDPSRTAVTEWVTTDGGGVRAVGIGGSLTGWPTDVLLCDDLIKDRQDAQSETVRQTAKDWITDVAMTRNPSLVIATGTPWHEDDALAFFNAAYPEMFDEIRLPALALENDPLGRPVGEPLCPERWPLERLLMQREANRHSFEALFQCNPTPREGALFRVGMLKTCKMADVPQNLLYDGKCVRHWDIGSGGVDSDYTASVCIAGPDREGNWYILNAVRGRWGAHERNSIMRRYAEEDGMSVMVTFPQDPGQAGVEQAASLKRLLAGFRLDSIRETGTKAVRAEPFAAQIEAGNVYLVEGDWHREFIEELRVFPNGRHDDWVDSGSNAFNRLALHTGAARAICV